MNTLTKIIEAIQGEQEKERKEQVFKDVLLKLKEKYSLAETMEQKQEIVDELLAIRRVSDIFKCYVQDWRSPNGFKGRGYNELSQKGKAGVALEFTNGTLTGRMHYMGMPYL